MKPSRLREKTREDLHHAVAYYAEHAPHMVDRFADAFLAARHHIETHPGTGSARYAKELGLAGTRFWTLNDFPYAVFYVERADFIDILRVLHQASDIPARFEN